MSQAGYAPQMTIEPPVITVGQTAYAVVPNDAPSCLAYLPEPGVVIVNGNVVSVLDVTYEDDCSDDDGDDVYQYPITGLSPGTYEVQFVACPEEPVLGPGCVVHVTQSLQVLGGAPSPVPALQPLASASLALVLLLAGLIARRP